MLTERQSWVSWVLGPRWPQRMIDRRQGTRRRIQSLPADLSGRHITELATDVRGNQSITLHGDLLARRSASKSNIKQVMKHHLQHLHTRQIAVN